MLHVCCKVIILAILYYHITVFSRTTCGENSYLIPVGGADSVGLWGYINAFQELINQGVLENFDDIVFACGSGGTATGLAVGNFLTGSKLRYDNVYL